METKLSFGQWVKQRRKALDMTQHVLAQRIGCALSTIQKIEIDARQPSPQIAELLAEYLEIAPAERDAFLRLARRHSTHEPPLLTVAPPLRQPLNNLPSPLTALVGREWEVTTLCARLAQADARLLTITGPPGIGKTRLCLQTAAQVYTQFDDGVCFVPLAAISESRFVIAAIARVLEVKDTGGQPLLERVKAYLHDRQLLLVLDNFEHLLSAAPLVVELLEAAPHLKILTTSRAILQVYGEHEFVAPPLALPDRNRLPPPDQLQHYAAIELFVQRARAVQQEFTLSAANAHTVAAICVRLEGLPLAIELAAARTKLFSPQVLLTRLQDALTPRLALLRGARHLPARHRTLRDAIAWSYDLLNPTEQRLFRTLAVFAGGCTPAALAAVSSQQDSASFPQAALNPESWLLNIVFSLVNHSLVIQQQEPDGALRFTLLEMMREYALEQLARSGEAEALGRAHANYFLCMAEAMVTAGRQGDSNPQLFRYLEVEIDNLRTALRWTAVNDSVLELRLLSFLGDFWQRPQYLSEGRHWLESGLRRITPEPTAHYAYIVQRLGYIYWQQGNYTLAQTKFEEAVVRWRQLVNQRELGIALHFLALVRCSRSEYGAARILAEESVAILRVWCEPNLVAMAMAALGTTLIALGEFTNAQSVLEEALVIYRELGHSWGVALVWINLAGGAFDQGDDATARMHLENALAIYRQLDETWFIAQTLMMLARISWRQGDKGQAQAQMAESFLHAHNVGAKEYLASGRFLLGLIAQEDGENAHASVLFKESIAIFQEMDCKVGAAYSLAGLASLLDSPRQAAQILGAVSTVLDRTRMPQDGIERVHYERIVAAVRVQLDDATFATAWAQGQAMTLTEAVTLV